MAANRTSLSAGYALYKLLTESPTVAAITGNVFPIVVDEAKLPYVAYRRKRMSGTAVKTNAPYDSCLFELLCCAKSLDRTIELAEAVRETLEGFRGDVAGLRVSRIELVDAEDGYDDDAFLMRLEFMISI